MGIGGSIVDSDFIESYLGMRVESVDEVEIIRRMTEGIYDHDEFERALAWAKKTCTIGFDKNPEELQMSEEKKEEQFEFVVKTAVIILIRNSQRKQSATMLLQQVSRDRDSGQTSIRTATLQRQF